MKYAGDYIVDYDIRGSYKLKIEYGEFRHYLTVSVLDMDNGKYVSIEYLDSGERDWVIEKISDFLRKIDKSYLW